MIIEGRDTIGRSIHYRVFGGYFETMFAGAGGEMLYWPHKSRVAIGASVAYVKQRDFDRGFGLLDYQVFTGHVSAYWATPFYNYDVAVHAVVTLPRILALPLRRGEPFVTVGKWESGQR